MNACFGYLHTCMLVLWISVLNIYVAGIKIQQKMTSVEDSAVSAKAHLKWYAPPVSSLQKRT